MGSRVITQTTTNTQSTTRDIGFTGQAGIVLAQGLASAGITAGRDVIQAGVRSQELSTVASANLLTTVENLAIINSNNLVTAEQGRTEGFNRLVGGATEVIKQQGMQAQSFLNQAAEVVARLGPQTKSNQNIAIGALAVVGIGLFLFIRRK